MAARPCKIYMFFGEKIINNKLVVFKTADKTSFTIKDFSCIDLKAALPAPNGIDFDKFDLTEAELLSLTTHDSWIAYCMHANNPKTLGQLAFGSIYGQADLTEIIKRLAEAFVQLGALNGEAAATLAGPGWRDFQGAEFQEKWAKMQTVFGWLKNVMETYYGKQFVVKVANDLSLAGGVCVKDKFGNKPAVNVKIDGEGGPFVASDSPEQGGGWPSRGVRQLLGLDIGLETEMFHSDDSRITTFVRMGPVKGIEKSIKQGGAKFKWDIDIAGISDTGAWKVKEIGGVDTLYAKAEVTGLVYFLVDDDRDNDNGQYVHFNMNSPITLKLSKEGLNCPGGMVYPGVVAALSLFADHVVGDPEQGVRDAFCAQVPPAVGAVEKVGAPVGRDHMNVLSMKNLAIFPVGIVLPFKSNVFVYGPWSFVANPIGGTIVAPNTNLCPWNFAKFGEDDGYDRMNLFGRLIASDGPKNYNKTEEGSITVACLPNFNMGAAVGGNTALLKDIAINFDSGGVTTTYQFSTYSAKFGEPAKHLLEAWSSNYKMLTKLKNYFKTERLKVLALANQNRVNVAGFVPVPGAVLQDGHLEGHASPSMLLISAYLPKKYYVNSDGGEDDIQSPSGSTDNWDPCYYTSPEGTIDPAPTGSKNQNDGRSFSGISEHTSWEFVQPNTYNQLSVMTLDGLFSPVSLTGVEGGKLPRLALYHNTAAAGAFSEFKAKGVDNSAGHPISSKTKDEIPPFTLTLNKSPATIYNRQIHQTYLNAYTSKKILDNWDGRKNSSTKGFIIFGISYGSDWKKMSLGEISDKRGGDIEERENQEDFRFSALKGPLMLQSWGYDTSGKPVPNAVDSAKNAEDGKFRKAGLTDNFMNNWLSNPKTWPVGPIDLRFDRERGVWVCPPGNKIVVAKLTDVLKPYGKVKAELVNAASDGVRFYEEYTIWGPLGENVKENIRLASIEVYDYLGVTLDKGDIVYAYYDEGRYIILESSRSYTCKSFHICTTTTTPPITTSIRTILPSATTTTSPVIYKFRNCCETDSEKTFSSPIIYQVIDAEPRSVSLEVGQVFSAKIPSDAAPACFIITEKFSSSSSPPTYSSVTIIEPYANCDLCAVIVGSCTPPTTTPLRPSAPTPTVATSCWCGLECLQTLENYDKTKTQALIHKEYAKDQSNKFIIRDGVTLDGCLSWENIVECSTPATPLPS